MAWRIVWPGAAKSWAKGAMSWVKRKPGMRPLWVKATTQQTSKPIIKKPPKAF